MADTLESLEIEVKSSATGAEKEIKSVTEAISGLSKAIAQALPNMKEFAETLGKIKSSAAVVLNGDNADKRDADKTSKSATRRATSSGRDNEPLNDDMREKIRSAGKLEVAFYKIVKAEEDMNAAFNEGNADAAWKQRERGLNAAAQAEREILKGEKERAKAEAAAAKEAEKQAKIKPPLSDEMREAISSADKVGVLQAKLAGLREALQNAFQAGDANKAYDIQGKILQTQAALDKANGVVKKTTRNAMSLSEAIKKNLEPMSSFVSHLKRIAMYRVMRTIIKAITQSMMEGLKYAYEFSKGITTQGHRFSEAMDQMKSATTKMKAQLGSAFISLLAALMPIFIKIINLVLRLADALSQFFAAFTGTTYLKAKDVAVDFEDTMEGGAQAAKEWKNQLLGFDEINKLEAPGDTGGGANTGLDPSQMFEDTKLSDWAMKVREVILWMQEHLELVKGIVAAIGIAFLTWKVANIVSNLLGIEGALNRVLLGVGLVTAGFYLLTSGLIEWIRTGELTEETFWKIEIGLLALGAGLALITGSWIPLAIAVVTAAVIAVITHFDKMEAKLEEWDEKLSLHLGNGKLEWQDFAAVFVRKVLEIVRGIETVVGWIKTLIGWIQSAVNWINSLGSSLGNGGAGTFLAGGYTPGQYSSGGGTNSSSLYVPQQSGPMTSGSSTSRSISSANNANISSAIEGGVSSAILSAGENNKGQPIVLNVNGRELARVLYNDQQAVAREHGMRLINY